MSVVGGFGNARRLTGAALVTAAPAVILLLVLTAMPLYQLAQVAAGDGLAGVARALGRPGAVRAIVHTVEVSVAVTALAVVAGAALALAVERHTAGRRRRLLRLLVAAQLVVPEFVLGFAWSQAYGPAGLGDRLLGLRIPGLFGPVGIVLVMSAHLLPLAYLATAAGLAVRADTDGERAARCAGATALTAFRTISLPLLRVPLLAGAALVFVSSVNSFAIPQVLGTPAGFSTMTTLVYRNLAFSADPAGFTDLTIVALSMVVLVLLVVGFADLRMGARSGSTRAAGPPGPVVVGRPGVGAVWAVTAAVVVYAVLAVGIPLLTVALTAITRAPGLLPAPANWTLANFGIAFAGAAPEALIRTVALGLAAAAIVPAIGAVAAAARGRGGVALSTTVSLSFAIPGTALAIGVMIAYGRWLTGSVVIILIAYLGKFWALGHRPIQAAVDRLPAEVFPAARVSGASAGTALRTVVLPLLSTGVAIAAMLVFVTATHELTMSAIMYGPGSETFAVVVLNQQELGNLGATAALSLVLTVPLIMIAGGLVLIGRRRQVDS